MRKTKRCEVVQLIPARMVILTCIHQRGHDGTHLDPTHGNWKIKETNE